MPVSVSTKDSSHIILLCLIGGPMAILWGLRRNALKREIQNTPTSKVRSAAMGRVELSGMAKQRKAAKSPLSNLDCCWWQCKVQELRKSGKSSKWVTIRTVGSIDLFYLDDLSGRVLVNPIGAEINVLNTTHVLNSSTRTKLSPLLQSWGVNDMNWFGMSNSLRILEECLPDCAPVYVLGDLSLTKNHVQDRQTRYLAKLRQVKADPEHMATADANKDGSVSAEEWDAYRLHQEELFLKEELAREPSKDLSEDMIVQAPAQGSFVISTGTESDVTGSLGWHAPGAILLGVIATLGGVYWANTSHWSPLFIVVLVGTGIAIGSFIKKQGAISWRSFF